MFVDSSFRGTSFVECVRPLFQFLLLYFGFVKMDYESVSRRLVKVSPNEVPFVWHIVWRRAEARTPSQRITIKTQSDSLRLKAGLTAVEG